MVWDNRHRDCGCDVSLDENSGKGGFNGVFGKEYIRISPFHSGLGALYRS
jgi:hypothetical protein